MLTDRNLNTIRVQSADAGSAPSPAYPASSFSELPPVDSGDYDDGSGGNGPCKAAQENLSAYLDNELDLVSRHDLEDHLAVCADCAAELDALRTIDTCVEREWRDSAPLPSSEKCKRAMGDIMSALPPVPEKAHTFAPKRIHARARWIRFAAGFSGIFMFGGLMWSSYRLGYAHGRTIMPSQQTPIQFNIALHGVNPTAYPTKYVAPADPSAAASTPPETQSSPQPLTKINDQQSR